MGSLWRIIIVFCLCVTVFMGCKPETPPEPLPPPASNGTDKPGESLLIREDEDELVQIRIEDGKASIYFDLDHWDELHNIYDLDTDYFNVEALANGPYPVNVERGKVKDACIGKLQLMDFSSYDFTLPVVVLMMVDGGMEWLYADPYMAEDYSHLGGEYEEYQNFNSMRLLAKVDGFSSFSYESDNEGFGAMAIYVHDEPGNKFDFYYLWLESELYTGIWACRLNEDWPVYGNLSFEEDGYFYFNVGEGEDYDPTIQYLFETWEGNAEIITACDQGYPLGTFVFDMWVTWWVDECVDGDCETGKLEQVQGSCRMGPMGSDGSLELYYNEGDDFYQQNKDWKVFSLQPVYD